MKTVTLSSKYQIVIPSAVRAHLNLTSGDKLVIDHIADDRVVLKKEPDYHDLIGTIKPQPQDPVHRIRKVRDAWK